MSKRKKHEVHLENLSEPDVIAREICNNLELALKEFKDVQRDKSDKSSHRQTG